MTPFSVGQMRISHCWPGYRNELPPLSRPPRAPGPLPLVPAVGGMPVCRLWGADGHEREESEEEADGEGEEERGEVGAALEGVGCDA